MWEDAGKVIGVSRAENARLSIYCHLKTPLNDNTAFFALM
jgi:hypothetical protein